MRVEALPHYGISALRRRDVREMISLYYVRIQEKVAAYRPGSWVLPDTKSADPLSVDFPVFFEK